MMMFVASESPAQYAPLGLLAGQVNIPVEESLHSVSMKVIETRKGRLTM